MDNVKIIANAHVLTCDPRDRGGRLHLLVRQGYIGEVTDRLDTLTSHYPHAEFIDAATQLILPGFVNAHFHGESFLLRHRTERKHFSLWKSDPELQKALDRLMRDGHHDDAHNAYLAACASHLKSGTTCIGEFGLPLEERGFVTMLEAIERTGVKSVVAVQTWDQMRHVEDLGPRRPRVVLDLGREEEFTVYSFENLCRASRDLNLPLIAHIAEQREGVEIIRRNFQKSVLGVLQHFDALKPETVLAHLNHIPKEDVYTLKGMNATVVVTPQSTAHKQTGYPALRTMASLNMRMALGTDWGNLDMVGEMRFMSQLPLVVARLRIFNPLEVVRMATINGAHALGVSAEIGSIEVGKCADLTFFDISDVRLPQLRDVPVSDELADLAVNHLSVNDIVGVMVNGEYCVREGRLTDISEEEIAQRFRSTHMKFFAPPAAPTSELGTQKPAPVKLKVIPFVPDQRTQAGQPEGFEQGFPTEKRPESVSENNHADQLPAVPESESVVPEPEKPKKSIRVFGEDDDF